MTEEIKYKTQIQTAVNRYGKGKSKSDREDLFQEGAVAVLSAERIDGPGHAYEISKNSILKYLRKNRNHPTKLSLSDAAVLREAENKSPPKKNQIERLSPLLSQLPENERKVLAYWFGIDCNRKTREEISKHLNQSIWWVHKTKTSGLARMKKLLEETWL